MVVLAAKSEHLSLWGALVRGTCLRHPGSAEHEPPEILGRVATRACRYDDRKWVAQISVGNKTQYLGSFKTQEEAAHAYNQEAFARRVRLSE